MTFEEDHYRERLQALVDGLVERTRAAIRSDKPLWEQPERGVYELSLTKSSMRIYSQDRDDQSPYLFELYNASGDLVETVSEDPFSPTIVRLKELYSLVSQGERQKAKDTVLTDVLQELDIDEPPPF